MGGIAYALLGKRHNAVVFSRVAALALLSGVNLAAARGPVAVRAYGLHAGDNIEYRYQVANLTRARGVTSVSIGNRGRQGDNPATVTNEQPELSVYPTDSYWGPPSEFGDQRGTSVRLGGIFESPLGWEPGILNYEETHKFSIDWELDAQSRIGVLPGQILKFGVTIPARSPDLFHPGGVNVGDSAYLQGHFTVAFDYSKSTEEGPSSWSYTGQIERLDTTPPTVSVGVSPATLRPPNNKTVPITVAITVKDNYDPKPEIKLESITANEPLGKDDILGAAFSTDDRSFSLMATRAGTSASGRIYTITYSATDASGNRSMATATVTVPHDQAKQ